MAMPIRTQQSIDAQIALLERELLGLKRQRNELSPISAVPPEILCQILLLATSYSPDVTSFADMPKRFRAARAFETLCHVSHSWRSTALGCPELWAEIDVGITTVAQQIDFVVKHAHPHTISLHVDAVTGLPPGRQYAQLKALYTVTQILSRRESFGKLVFVGGIQLLLDLPPVTRPEGLQTLQISVSDGNVLGYDAAGASIAQHPLFTGGVRGLRTLGLEGCAIPLTSPILMRSPQLRSLSLQIQGDSRVAHLLNILSNTPQLEQLHLIFRGPFLLSQESLDPVHLPCLSQVNITGDAGSIFTIVLHLRLSAVNLSLNLFCMFAGLNSALMRQASAIVFRVLGDARRSPGSARATLPSEHPFSPRLLRLGCPPIVDLEGVCSVTMGNGMTHGNTGTGDVPLEVNSETGPSATAVAAVVFYDLRSSRTIDWAEWHPLMLANHPDDLRSTIGWSMDELDTFGFDDDRDYPDSLWQFLSSCPKIFKLAVAASHVPKLLPLLPTDNGTFPFPSLRRVEVVCTSTAGSSSVGRGCDSLLESFLDALRGRQALFSESGRQEEWVLDELTLKRPAMCPSQHLVEAAQAQGLIGCVVRED